MQLLALPVLAACVLAATARHVGEAVDNAGSVPPPSLKHDTDVDKNAKPNKVLFLVDVLRPPVPKDDPVMTNEVDTTRNEDEPHFIRVLVEADVVDNSTGDDYVPRPAPPTADEIREELSRLLAPPLEQAGLSYDWTKEDASVIAEPSTGLVPPPQGPALDWTSPARDLLPPTPESVFTELEPPTKDSYPPKKASSATDKAKISYGAEMSYGDDALYPAYHPEKPSSGKPGPDEFKSFGVPPKKTAEPIWYGDDMISSYLPEAGEVIKKGDGPVVDDFLAIGVPPEMPKEEEEKKEAEDIAPPEIDSYTPDEPSSGFASTDDFAAVGVPPAESKVEVHDSYFPEQLSFVKPDSDDFAAIGEAPKKSEDVKDSYVPDQPSPGVAGQDDFADTGVPPPEEHVHDHAHDHVHQDQPHEHVHDDGHATTPSPSADDDDHDDEVDGDGVKVSESKDFRKKRHICKVCGGYGGGHGGGGYIALPPVTINIQKGGYGGGGGGYCDVCGRPVVQQPVYQQPVYQQPVYHPQPQPVCSTCNQPPPPCSTCGGNGGGNSGSFSQSSSQSSSSSYSSGWGKK